MLGHCANNWSSKDHLGYGEAASQVLAEHGVLGVLGVVALRGRDVDGYGGAGLDAERTGLLAVRRSTGEKIGANFNQKFLTKK